jgi:hypothetical protein
MCKILSLAVKIEVIHTYRAVGINEMLIDISISIARCTRSGWCKRRNLRRAAASASSRGVELGTPADGATVWL